MTAALWWAPQLLHSLAPADYRSCGKMAPFRSCHCQPGETLGDANSVNASTVAVGSVDAGISQRGVIYSGGNATVITQTTTDWKLFPYRVRHQRFRAGS